MGKMRIPKAKVVLAFSFEGIVNNGARECAFTSFNAHRALRLSQAISGEKFFDRHLKPEEFNSPAVQKSLQVRAFMALRPLVKDAEDYLTIMQLIELYPEECRELLGRKVGAVAFFQREFEKLKSASAQARVSFKEEFYLQREGQKTANFKEWLSLQSPFKGIIRELRKLQGLRALENGKAKGFVLSFVSSKDEASIMQLCSLYSELGHLAPGEVSTSITGADLQSMGTCLISPERVIGKETSTDKVEQVRIIAERGGVPLSHIWRLNDRLDTGEIHALRNAGVNNNFVVTGGYAFPGDYSRAPKSKAVVVEKETLAYSLSRYATEHGF